MKNFSKPITVNGFVNVWSAIKAAGYAGKMSPVSLSVSNNSATAAYIHFTDNGATAPSTGSDGYEFSTGAAGTVYKAEGVDLATTWLNTGSSISIKVAVTGG